MQTKAPISDAIVPSCADLLLVTASQGDADLWRQCLESSGWHGHAEVVENPSDIFARCRQHPCQAILLDQSHPKLTPRLTSEILRRLGGYPPVILITDALSEASALEGLASGAFDYVFRSCLGRLPLAMQRAVEAADLRVDLEGADDELREIEARFQSLAETVCDGVALEGQDGILYANPALADLLQARSTLDLLGHDFVSFLTEEHANLLTNHLNSDTAGVDSEIIDIALQRQDGSTIDARLSFRRVLFRGTSVRLLVVQDRREQRRVESVISQLATFAQENPNPILIFSADGRITYYNSAALEMANKFGRDHPSYCVPPQATAVVESCMISNERRERVVWEMSGRSFAWSFFPHRSSGVVHALVTEITDQRKLEEQLRHSQRLEGVGRLAGGVAHQFSNLLTVIQGQAELIAQSEALSPQARGAMQQLLHATETAARMTCQLKSFSRRNQVRTEAVQLLDITEDLRAVMSAALGESIRFSLELDPAVPAIMADRALMEQVFLNLAMNAQDAMPDGGELVVAISRVDIPQGRLPRHPESRPGSFVRVTFTDTGCGMDPRILPYVFEPFFTTKSSDSVSGLGLSTTYGIIRQHNGWIEVASQRGLGTTFQVYLPEAPSWATEDQAAGDVGAGGDRKPSEEVVLVVEDEPAVRHTLRSMLLHEGFQVIEAGSALEALGLWRTRQSEITVLLTDLVMPSGISGQELARHLQASKAELTVIYTSGYGIDSVGRGLPVEVGVNFLQKPFAARDFTLALQRCKAMNGRNESRTHPGTGSA
ncbi:MAG: response regulator [Verrucomicrobia bacterium]|nr:response regulator [Verrucomicrobiota bacterium]